MSKIIPITKGRTAMEIATVQAEIDIAYKLAESIRKHPRKWGQDNYCFSGPGPMVFWTANGEQCFDQYHSDYRGKAPVILTKEICQKIIWPAYIEWKLQINTDYLHPESPFAWVRSLWRRTKDKPVALLEYKPERPLK